MAALDNYVCTDCGYLESYIAEKDKRKEITEDWRNLQAAETAEEEKKETRIQGSEGKICHLLRVICGYLLCVIIDGFRFYVLSVR